MTLKTLMLSAATGALLMSPALAQDDQTDDAATEEVTVPLEGEVTIEVEVTDVETNAGDGDDTEDDDGGEGDSDSGEGDSTEIEDSGEETTEGETGDESMSDDGESGDGESAGTSDMGDDAATSDDDEGLSVADDDSGDGMSDEETGDSTAEGEDAGTEADMQSEDGLSAEEDQQSDMVEGQMESDEGLIVDEDSGDSTASDESALEGGLDDQTEAPDYGSFAGMTVGDILSMEVQTPDQRRVGDIDYLIVRDGAIEAVIGVGGFLSLGEYTVALPLEDFQLVADGDRLHIDQTEDELRAMPEIDESNLEGLDRGLLIEDVAASL